MGKKVWNFSVIEKAFLTGCDNKTEWMLEWWFKRYLYSEFTAKEIREGFAWDLVSKGM